MIFFSTIMHNINKEQLKIKKRNDMNEYYLGNLLDWGIVLDKLEAIKKDRKSVV